MSIVTEEMKYRQRLCEYALKYGVTKAARRYHTYRQFVYRQLKNITGKQKVLHYNQENRNIVQKLIQRRSWS